MRSLTARLEFTRCLSNPRLGVRSIRSSATAAAKPTPDTPSLVQEATPTALARWTPTSRRVGLIAKKIGMTTYFLPSGQRIPATVLQVSQNQISAHIGFSSPTINKDGSPILPRKIASRLAYTALQVAATDAMGNASITQQVKGHLRKAGIKTNKKIIREFKVTKDALVPLGTFLSAAHFVPGQQIDVKAKSRGKGFQGVMKRHGFHGLRASHGVSVSHRSGGSTGMNQSPGRVFPGKKMAGRMGGDETTKHNLDVLRIDTIRDVILVKGNVPGPEGGHVLLSDAKRALIGKAANAYSKGTLLDGKGRATGEETSEAYLPAGVVDLPFPAGTREMAKALPEIVEVAPEATVVKEA
ncbi:hypothetical protein CBS101457_002579 [Exobasidium rhododendri]|nr:hypothetical protein CBS101457_002579 [Exobasidium rhododendri]